LLSIQVDHIPSQPNAYKLVETVEGVSTVKTVAWRDPMEAGVDDATPSVDALSQNTPRRNEYEFTDSSDVP